jgi:hypothetical protein
MCDYAVKHGYETLSEYINLEERIADTAAFVMLKTVTGWTDKTGEILTERFAMDATDFALPWLEVERAVKCYLKDKDCPKVELALQYYKQVVSQITTVYEGQFNGTVIRKEKRNSTVTSGHVGVVAG